MQESSYHAVISFPLGKLGIKTDEKHLTSIQFLEASIPLVKPRNIIAAEIVEQLQCYFADPLYPFNIPIALDVTPFQKSILKHVQYIPVGKTETYGSLAQKLHTNPRVIGNACRHNPIPIVIPCHRVIAENGLGGFSGSRDGVYVNIKQWLLSHESVAVEALNVRS